MAVFILYLCNSINTELIIYRWAKLNMIEFRAPHQVGKEIAKGINEGRIKFADKHLSMFPQDVCSFLLLLLPIES
jgi:acyl-CoA hydrolase